MTTQEPRKRGTSKPKCQQKKEDNKQQRRNKINREYKRNIKNHTVKLSCFLEKINKTDKILIRLLKKTREKTT